MVKTIQNFGPIYIPYKYDLRIKCAYRNLTIENKQFWVSQFDVDKPGLCLISFQGSLITCIVCDIKNTEELKNAVLNAINSSSK